MNDCDYKNVQEDSKYYNQDATSRALASSVNSSKFAPARCPPPPYSPVTSSPPKYSPKRIEETMNLPPPVYTSEILKVGSSTAARELEKGERVCVRSPQPNKKLAFYPYSSPRMHTLDHHNYFTHGEVGLVIDKYTGSNEVLYNVELSRGAKGWISRKCIERYKACHESTIVTDTDAVEPQSTLDALQMRIEKLERQKEEAVASQDFLNAQRIKEEEIIALRKQRKKHTKMNRKHRKKSDESNSVCVYGTAVDNDAPQKSHRMVSQDVVVAQQIHKKNSELDSFGPQVSFDDGKSWQSFPIYKRSKRRKTCISTRGIVFNLGFGSFAITEYMGGREALAMHGFEVRYCKLSSKEKRQYDHNIYDPDGKQNLYDYAREKVVPYIRHLAKKGRCPAAILAGSRGGQETLHYVWRNCYRGPTVCLNASCFATTIAESYAYRGVHYTMENSPSFIPLVVTTSDNDEVGFAPQLAHTLCELYRRRGHLHLIAQYHCPSDPHVPESVPSLLGLLVRLAVGMSTCTNVPQACGLPCLDALKSVKSFYRGTYTIVGGVKI